MSKSELINNKQDHIVLVSKVSVFSCLIDQNIVNIGKTQYNSRKFIALRFKKIRIQSLPVVLFFSKLRYLR